MNDNSFVERRRRRRKEIRTKGQKATFSLSLSISFRSSRYTRLTRSPRLAGFKRRSNRACGPRVPFHHHQERWLLLMCWRATSPEMYIFYNTLQQERPDSDLMARAGGCVRDSRQTWLLLPARNISISPGPTSSTDKTWGAPVFSRNSKQPTLSLSIFLCGFLKDPSTRTRRERRRRRRKR